MAVLSKEKGQPPGVSKKKNPQRMHNAKEAAREETSAVVPSGPRL